MLSSSAKYSVIIRWSIEDECFIATVPELPGCMAVGETREEAAKEVEDAMASWLEACLNTHRKPPVARVIRPGEL